MKSTIIFIVTLSIIGFYGCKSEETVEQQTKENPKSRTQLPADFTFSLYHGHWLDKEFFQTLKSKHSFVDVKHPSGIMEIIFPSEYNDSAVIVMANNEKKVKIFPKSADTLAFSEGILSYNNTANVEVLDWIDKKGGKRVFERLSDAKNGENQSLLTYLINRNTVCGDFFKMNEKGMKTDDFVVFKSDGSIIGWEDYEKYNVCYTQDCLQLPGQPIDVIQLTKGETSDFYAWKMIDYDAENEKEENKTKSKKKKKYGLVFTLYRIITETTKKGSLKTDTPTFEFSVNKLG